MFWEPKSIILSEFEGSFMFWEKKKKKKICPAFLPTVRENLEKEYYLLLQRCFHLINVWTRTTHVKSMWNYHEGSGHNLLGFSFLLQKKSKRISFLGGNRGGRERERGLRKA